MGADEFLWSEKWKGPSRLVEAHEVREARSLRRSDAEVETARPLRGVATVRAIVSSV